MRPYISGKLVDLHPLTKDDESYLYDLYISEDSGYERDIIPVSPEAFSKTFAGWLEQSTENARFIVSLKGGRQPIGMVGLTSIYWMDRSANVVIIIHANHRGKGYGTEAIHLLFEYGFRTLGLHRIYMDTNENNLAARRILEKNGCRLIGIKHESYYRNSRWENEAEYEILESAVLPQETFAADASFFTSGR